MSPMKKLIYNIGSCNRLGKARWKIRLLSENDSLLRFGLDSDFFQLLTFLYLILSPSGTISTYTVLAPKKDGWELLL